MKWFYNLRRLYRNIIAGALWGALLLVAGIAGGIYGDNVDNMHPAVAVAVVALLVGAIVFTVFASIATNKEKQANNQKTTPPPPRNLQSFCGIAGLRILCRQILCQFCR